MAELELDFGVVVVLVDEVVVDEVLEEDVFLLAALDVDDVDLLDEELLVAVEPDDVEVGDVVDEVDVLDVAAAAVCELASARVATTAPPPRRESPVSAAVAVRARRRTGRLLRGMEWGSELGIGIPIERGQVDASHAPGRDSERTESSLGIGWELTGGVSLPPYRARMVTVTTPSIGTRTTASDSR